MRARQGLNPSLNTGGKTAFDQAEARQRPSVDDDAMIGVRSRIDGSPGNDQRKGFRGATHRLPTCAGKTNGALRAESWGSGGMSLARARMANEARTRTLDIDGDTVVFKIETVGIVAFDIIR